jgi:hypothetical protein
MLNKKPVVVDADDVELRPSLKIGDFKRFCDGVR